MVLRRIAYTLLSLWRSVTLPGHATPVTAPDGRGVMRPRTDREWCPRPTESVCEKGSRAGDVP
ncbi:MAG: hypothetical protein L6Q84_31465 [Polyangiaceae bacterium]|nr:hypothetical protein [Polyangiaceae bacterium]